MPLLRFLAKTAMATNLTYKILMTSLLIAGTAYEVYKRAPRAPHEPRNRLK